MTSGAVGPPFDVGVPGTTAKGARRGAAGKLTAIISQRALFDEAVETAKRYGSGALRGESGLRPEDVQFVSDTRKAFDALNDKVDQHGVDHIEQHAERLAQRRAYVLPMEEILAQCKEISSDLRQWGVPESELAEIDDLIKNGIEGALKDRNIKQARSSFRRLLERADYWDWYITNFNASKRLTSYVLCGLSIVLMLGAGYVYFRTRHALTGLMLAGASGAAVSILLKQPGVIIYKESAEYLPRILGRLVAGIAAAGLGIAVLASGLVEVRMPSTGQTTSQVVRCQAGEMAEATISAAGAASPGSTGPAPCSSVGAGVLLALAFVFGFSERALTTLEDTLAKPFGFTRGEQARRQPRDDDGDAVKDEGGKAAPAEDGKAPAGDKQPA